MDLYSTRLTSKRPDWLLYIATSSWLTRNHSTVASCEVTVKVINLKSSFLQMSSAISTYLFLPPAFPWKLDRPKLGSIRVLYVLIWVLLLASCWHSWGWNVVLLNSQKAMEDQRVNSQLTSTLGCFWRFQAPLQLRQLHCKWRCQTLEGCHWHLRPGQQSSLCWHICHQKHDRSADSSARKEDGTFSRYWQNSIKRMLLN